MSQITRKGTTRRNSNLNIVTRKKFFRYKQPVTPDEAYELLKKAGHIQIDDFVFDEYNAEAFLQMLYYFYGDRENFQGDMQKGLFLVGKIGAGKTQAFEIFKRWIAMTGFDKRPHTIDFNIAHTKRVVSEFENEEKDQGGIQALKKYLSTKAWVFNDLGKELEDRNIPSHYNTKLNVFKYILDERYILFKDFGIVSHATSNYPIEGKSGTRYFKKLYGNEIDNRMTEMFNTIVFKGNSRRK